MASAPHQHERRSFQWKKWGAGALAVLAVAVPMYTAYKSNQNQINEARDLSQTQHTAAQVDRAVVHDKIDDLEDHEKFTDQQIEDLWKECKKP